MSTATLPAAPAAPPARRQPEVFTLCRGETHYFYSEKLENPNPLPLKVVIAEVSPSFMQINGYDMNGPWLKQTVGPPPDPDSHMSDRLRSQKLRRQMPRADYRWTYTVPGVVRFFLSEVKYQGKPAVRFEVDETY